MTSGSFEFNPNNSSIKLDFSKDFSIFNLLSNDETLSKESIWNNQLSKEFAKNKKLFYNDKNSSITSIKVLSDKKSESKIPVEIKYKTIVKRQKKENTIVLYFNKDDDSNISREFKNQALKLLNDQIFKYNQLSL